MKPETKVLRMRSSQEDRTRSKSDKRRTQKRHNERQIKREVRY